jgi:hypothetical protein
VFNELSVLRLRALLARVRGDDTGYRAHAKDLGELAHSIDFEQGAPSAAAMS